MRYLLLSFYINIIFVIKNNPTATEANQVPLLLIATHNRKSLAKASNFMETYGLGISHSVSFAQIMGMCDNLTYNMGLKGYNVSKLVCFGKFEEV